LVESDTAWYNLKSPGYSWYGNHRAFFMINRYGVLYNWYTVKTGRLCPAGWHIPDTDEWYTLLEYLGYNEAGGKLKATGTHDWLTPNTGATNETGFIALPGGFRNAYYNDFQRFRSAGYFWHSNISDAMRLNYNSSDVTHTSLQRNDGASVRCVKD
ncbi:MAG: fibrobacter succinogenes major paralogous domain-containing protein, partial [Bacteroidales bacterium]|nr:fibrobacter succinogenes major paralogous domain-containing protein [Bacteroidales bacterium]